MLKIIAVFMLLVVNGAPIEITSPGNSSINNTFLNDSNLNDTQLNNWTEYDDWFNESTKLNLPLALNQLLDEIKHEYLDESRDNYAPEKPMPDSQSPNQINPTETDNPKPGRNGPEEIDVPLEGGCSEPVCTDDGICYVECWD